MTKLNWKQEPSGSGPIFPDGTYKIKIIDYERVKASTGTLQIRWKGTVLEPVEHKGRPLTIHTPLTEKSIWKVKNLIFACGIDTSKLPDGMDTNSSQFSKVCDLCVDRTTFWRNAQGADLKGNPKNEIVQFIQDPEQGLIAVEDDAPAFARE